MILDENGIEVSDDIYRNHLLRLLNELLDKYIKEEEYIHWCCL